MLAKIGLMQIKRVAYAMVVFNLFLSSTASAQPNSRGKYIGIAYVDNSNTLVEINPIAGTVKTVQSYPGLAGISFGISAVDAKNNRIYYFVASNSLVGVNTETGAIITNPPLAYPLSSLEYNTLTLELLGVTSISNVITFAEINPFGGDIIPHKQYPGYTSVLYAVSAVDPIQNRFTFVMDGYLFTVDVPSGNVLSNPTVTQSFAWLEFDTKTSTLIGMTSIDKIQTLVKIDRQTGKLTTIATYPGYSSVSLGLSTLNSNRNLLTFVMDNNLVTVRADTGQILFKPSVSHINLSSFQFVPPK